MKLNIITKEMYMQELVWIKKEVQIWNWNILIVKANNLLIMNQIMVIRSKNKIIIRFLLKSLKIHKKVQKIFNIKYQNLTIIYIR